jgi:Alkylmercury lyase
LPGPHATSTMYAMTIANDVRVEIYRSFTDECRAPTPKEMAQRLNVSIEDARSGLSELAEQDVIAFHPGTQDLWLAHPFCASSAPFTVHSKERTWDAICVWDALGILALVERDGFVSTACPDCNETLEIEVRDGVARTSTEAVVHFGVPARDWYADVGFT